jgi:hypothetical protein
MVCSWEQRRKGRAAMREAALVLTQINGEKRCFAAQRRFAPRGVRVEALVRGKTGPRSIAPSLPSVSGGADDAGAQERALDGILTLSPYSGES